MTFTLALRRRVAFELLAQLQLLELARCGHRDGLHEFVGVGQPEPGEVHFQVGVQLVRGDPLPPALYEVFAAVCDLDEPETVYGDYVPRLEPIVVRKLVVPLRRLIVRTRDPRTANF